MDKHQCSNVEILKKLVENNENARKNITAGLVAGYHKKCGDYVKLLMNSNFGIVSTHYRILFDIGKGNPGDPVCINTFEYSKLLLEEESSNDINTILKTEIMERKIRSLIEEKKIFFNK